MRFEGCPVCGPHAFHRWWCPELRSQVHLATVIVTIGAIAVLVIWHRFSNRFVAIALVVGFGIADVSLWVAQRRRSDRLDSN